MKNLIMKAAMILLVITSTVAYASPGKLKTPEQRADMWIKRMTGPLSLTPEQTPKLKEAVIKREIQRDADREKFADDKEGFKKASMLRQRDFNASVKPILTAEQYAKLEQIRKEMREKRKANKAAKNGADKPKGNMKDDGMPADDEPEMD